MSWVVMWSLVLLGKYYGSADKNKYGKMDGVLHDTLNLVDDHFSYMGQMI